MADILEVKHVETRTVPHPLVIAHVKSECTCGAHWTHPYSREPEVMDSIFESHVKGSKAKVVIRD